MTKDQQGVGLAEAVAGVALDRQGPDGSERRQYSMCGYAQVRDDHEIVDACDTRADGDGYFIRYRVSSGAVGTVGDGNGNLWPRSNCTSWQTA